MQSRSFGGTIVQWVEFRGEVSCWILGGGRRSRPGGDIVVAILLTAVRVIFFFQAEDGIRDVAVTGVQTCALPICHRPRNRSGARARSGSRRRKGRFRRRVALRNARGGRCRARKRARRYFRGHAEIGRASCRERG